MKKSDRNVRKEIVQRGLLIRMLALRKIVLIIPKTKLQINFMLTFINEYRLSVTSDSDDRLEECPDSGSYD